MFYSLLQNTFPDKFFGNISKIDILVCTAGRLVDHLKLTPGFNLQDLEFLIIDEADRVLDSVQNDWLYHLEKHLYDDGKLRKICKKVSVCDLCYSTSVYNILHQFISLR